MSIAAATKSTTNPSREAASGPAGRESLYLPPKHSSDPSLSPPISSLCVKKVLCM